jgi:hypothetical protein
MACGWNDKRPKILELSGNLRREIPGEMFAPSYGLLFLDEFLKRCDWLLCTGNPFESFAVEWNDQCLNELNIELGSLCECELL